MLEIATYSAVLSVSATKKIRTQKQVFEALMQFSTTQRVCSVSLSLSMHFDYRTVITLLSRLYVRCTCVQESVMSANEKKQIQRRRHPMTATMKNDFIGILECVSLKLAGAMK